MDYRTLLYPGSNNFKRWFAKIILGFLVISLFSSAPGMFNQAFQWFDIEWLTTARLMQIFLVYIIIWLHVKYWGL